MLRIGAKNEGRSVGKCAAAWQVPDDELIQPFASASGAGPAYGIMRIASEPYSQQSLRVASIARKGGVGSTALTTTHFLLLYSAMLVASSGNTALQSVMPAIGREIGID